MTAFRMQRQVQFAETDMAGVAHFTALFRYVEEAEHAFLRGLGIPVVAGTGRGAVGWPRAACAFEFHAPLRFEDTVEVVLHLERLGRSSVAYRAGIWRQGRLLAEGTATSVCCRLERDGAVRAIPIPPAIRRKLQSAIDAAPER